MPTSTPKPGKVGSEQDPIDRIRQAAWDYAQVDPQWYAPGICWPEWLFNVPGGERNQDEAAEVSDAN